MPKILFLSGPPGSGKSHFAGQYLAPRGWSHLEIDRHSGRDGIDAARLRSEWDEFFIRYDPVPLYEALVRRLGSGTQLVLSFPSLVFRPQHLGAGAGYFYFAFLYGHPSLCLQGFLKRERETGSDAGGAYWDRFAPDSFGGLSLSFNQPLLVEAFSADGSRRDCEAMYEDIRKLIDDGQPTST